MQIAAIDPYGNVQVCLMVKNFRHSLRDRPLRDIYFEEFPESKFTVTAIAPAAEGFDVTGNFDLHGVTKSISFPARISIDESRVRAQAEFAIKRFEFGIVYPGKQDDLIRDDVVISLNLVALPAVETAS